MNSSILSEGLKESNDFGLSDSSFLATLFATADKKNE